MRYQANKGVKMFFGDRIYFLKYVDSNIVKIGYSGSVVTRLLKYCLYDNRIELMLIIDGDKAKERDLHLMFKNFLNHGREWFMESPQIIEYIKQNYGNDLRYKLFKDNGYSRLTKKTVMYSIL